MLTFSEYLQEEYNSIELDEALITFARKAYPKFGQAVIIGGGAGSGKGFILDNLLGIEGKVFDVDALKKLAAATPAIVKKVKEETGFDLSKLDPSKPGQEHVMQNPDNTFKLHEIVGEYLNLPHKQQTAFFASVLTTAPERKPNIIFDVTLKDIQKLANISRHLTTIGYDTKNIHIVWVVNDVEIAKKQNISRGMKPGGRSVPQEILISTHRGAQQTMLDIINMGKDLSRYMDGQITLAFNQAGVDSEVMFGDKTKSGVTGKTHTPMVIKKANYVTIKEAGKPVTPLEKIDLELRKKISSYVPHGQDWI